MVEKPTKEEFPKVIEKMCKCLSEEAKEIIKSAARALPEFALCITDWNLKGIQHLSEDGVMTFTVEEPPETMGTISYDSDAMHGVFSGTLNPIPLMMQKRLTLKNLDIMKLNAGFLPILVPLQTCYNKVLKEMKG